MLGFLDGDRAVKKNGNPTSADTPLKIVQFGRSGNFVFTELLEFIAIFSGLAGLILAWFECSHCGISLNTPA
jgi:hypothetical protein